MCQKIYVSVIYKLLPNMQLLHFLRQQFYYFALYSKFEFNELIKIIHSS